MNFIPGQLWPSATDTPEPTAAIAGGLDIAAALGLVLAGVRPLDEAESLSVGDALGRTVIDDARSLAPLPRFDNSAMDGYAIHTEDLAFPGWLPIAGRVQAGPSVAGTVMPGTAVRVTTGAALPVGTAAVVPDEDVDLRAGADLRLHRPVRPGANIRWRGEDVAEGDILVAAGTRINARHIAILSATGVCDVRVRRRPKVALLSIGNELVAPGGVVAPGEIIDVNKILLRSLLKTAGAEVIDLGMAFDTIGDVVRVLSTLPQADLLLTTGGVAGSECDVTLSGMRAAGGGVSRLQLALKPGRLIGLGQLGQTRSLHLPGNPISALVTAQLFAVPMLRVLSGASPVAAMIFVEPDKPILHRRGRTEFVLVKITGQSKSGRPIVARSGNGGSAALKPLVEADGFAEIPAAFNDVLAGDDLRFHPFVPVFG